MQKIIVPIDNFETSELLISCVTMMKHAPLSPYAETRMNDQK